MKSTTLIFYGHDGDAAKEAAAKMRKDGLSAQLRHAEAFDGEKEPIDRVVTLPCVSEYDLGRISRAYGDVMARAATVPPPPPPPVDALANLPKDWKNERTKALMAIATSIDGRAPENREQAVQLIESALAARAAV